MRDWYVPPTLLERKLHFIEKERLRNEKITYVIEHGSKAESILNKEYDAIHRWLHKIYGSASKCENKQCDHSINVFNWCKIRGLNYDYKRENFIQLCKRCHKKYDSNKHIEIEL